MTPRLPLTADTLDDFLAMVQEADRWARKRGYRPLAVAISPSVSIALGEPVALCGLPCRVDIHLPADSGVLIAAEDPAE